MIDNADKVKIAQHLDNVHFYLSYDNEDNEDDRFMALHSFDVLKKYVEKTMEEDKVNAE